MANSNLISNLNSIYATKLEIKEILNTESDDFTQYPDLIEVAIASGGATGTYNITENGTFDVATYASAYVDVPQKEVPVVPPGYSYVYGTKEILENGTIDISSYANAYVNVPAPEGWILPSGYAYITANGNFDIREFESVNVNVPTGGGAAVLGNLSVTENGQYSASAYSYDGFDTVNVNVPIPTLGEAMITVNGNYSASDLGFDGLNSVIVNVPTSGGGSSHTGSSVYDAMTIKEALDWVYANLKVGESSSDWFYVKGIIAEASSPITAQYGNFNAWLTDDGQMHYQTEDPTLSDLTKCLYVFRGMFYGHSTEHSTWDPNTDMQIHVGDQVIMYCQLRWHTSSVPRIINGNTIKQGVTAQNQLTISQSGTYDVQNYVSAYVNVPGGGSTTTLSVSGEYGMYSGKYYIYDTNLMTYLTLLEPIANAGLGDTVSGTVEYSDIDGSGMPYKYICKNFNGTSTQDSDRVYTSLNVNYYSGTSSSMLLSTVGGDISSNYYPLETENGVTYYLPSNYSGSTIENGSTVYCYISECYPMMEQKYMINEVVNVVTPNLTGVSYSTDSGTTWNSMVSDTMINGYSADNLGISIDPMNGHSLNIRCEYDNGSYKYVTNYVSITSGMNPYSSMIQKDPMMTSMNIQNDSGSNIKISKIGVNNDTIFVYWEQGITYDYYLMSYNSDDSYSDRQQLVDNSWNDIQITGDYFLIGKYQGDTQEAILYANTSNYTDGDNVSWYVLDTTGTNVGSSGSYKILNTNNLDKIYWNKLSGNITGGLVNKITVKNASDDSTITTIKENYSSNIQLAANTDIYIVNNVNNTFKLTSATTVRPDFADNYSFYNTLDHANATYNLTVPAGTWDLGFSIGAMNEILLSTTYYNS